MSKSSGLQDLILGGFHQCCHPNTLINNCCTSSQMMTWMWWTMDRRTSNSEIQDIFKPFNEDLESIVKRVGVYTLFDGASSGSSPLKFSLDKELSTCILLPYFCQSIPSLPYMQKIHITYQLDFFYSQVICGCGHH